jgi:hypothetical protein
MPRFIAHVRTPNGCLDSVDCDFTEVDGNGYLWLTQGPKNQQPHACYAPDAWLSYTLQAPPEDAPEPGLTVIVAFDGAEILRQTRRNL